MNTIDPARYTVSLRARRLRGAAALMEALEHIGAPHKSDHDMASIIIENELELREFLSYALISLAKPSEDIV